MKAPLFKTALLVAGVAFLVGCQKDVADLSADNALENKAVVAKDKQIERPLKGSIVTHTHFTPDIAGGWVGGPVPAWYPGEGEGNLTHMGKIYTVFNQYASTVVVDDDPLTLLGQSTRVIPTFTTVLKGYGFSDSDIQEMYNRNVGYVIVTKEGSSIWSEGTYLTYAVGGPTRTVVYAEVKIIGGTGRFANATGEYTISGYSDQVIPFPQNLSDPTSIDILDINGVIRY